MKQLSSLAFLIFLSTGSTLPQKKPHKSLTIGFVGDMMLGRLVNEQIKRTGCSFIWGDVLPLLKKNTCNIGNLETTFTQRSKKVPKVFNFKSNPANVCTLVEGNFAVVNLANNHSLDFYAPGLEDTIATLNAAGIQHVGAGKNAHAAQQPAFIHINGLTIAILGYTDNEPGWKAQANKSGINYVRVGDTKRLRNDIQSLRPQADMLIVTLHWGPNMRQRPTQDFITFAHRIIDAGADIVHGHSAHVVQGVEVYRNKLIMYDTGDFIDDYRVDPHMRNDRSCLFQVHIKNKQLHSLRLVPVRIDHMHVNKASSKEAQAILQTMRTLSAEFGTTVDKHGVINLQPTKKIKNTDVSKP